MKIRLRLFAATRTVERIPNTPILDVEMERGDDEPNLYYAEFGDVRFPLHIFVETIDKDEIDWQIIDVSYWKGNVPPEIQKDIELWLAKGLLKKTGTYTYEHTHDHACDVYKDDPGDCNCGAGTHRK